MNKKELKLWFFFIVIVGCIVISLQNTNAVTMKFFFWQLSMSRIVLFVVAFLSGLMLGYWLGRK